MMADTTRARSILVFAKAPEPGAVKTRLAAALGADRTAQLYARLARRTLRLAAETAPGAVQLWCAPDTSHPFFAECARAFGVRLCSQTGADLGERMAHALAVSVSEHRLPILVGTDCPDYTREYFLLAFESLEAGYDVVLGPARDGGYALVGLTRALPELFRGVAWGGADVMAQTRVRLNASGTHWFELEPVRDLDRPEDLAAFAADEDMATLLGAKKEPILVHGRGNKNNSESAG
jgi:uncharacterized protein